MMYEVPKSEIQNDSLIRYLPVPDVPRAIQSRVVITKEEFITCYNVWIKGDKE